MRRKVDSNHPLKIYSGSQVKESDRRLKLAPGTILLKLLISSRGRSKPTDRFRRIPTPGSHRILSSGFEKRRGTIL
jgi:hypothetical protein